MPAPARLLQDPIALDQFVEAAQEAFAVLAILARYLQHSGPLPEQRRPVAARDHTNGETVTPPPEGGNQDRAGGRQSPGPRIRAECARLTTTARRLPRGRSAEVRGRPPGCDQSAGRPCVSPGIDIHPHRNGGPMAGAPDRRHSGGSPTPPLKVPDDSRPLRSSRTPSAGTAGLRSLIGGAISAAADIPELCSASRADVCHIRVLGRLPLGTSVRACTLPEAMNNVAAWPIRDDVVPVGIHEITGACARRYALHHA